jgi:hypothetical protein
VPAIGTGLNSSGNLHAANKYISHGSFSGSPIPAASVASTKELETTSDTNAGDAGKETLII